MKIKTSDALKEFGDRHALAKALGITWQAVQQWGEFVPALRAYQIAELRRHKNHPQEKKEQQAA